MNPETYTLGTRDSLGTLIEFGADFYTEIYHMTYSAAHQVQKAYVNILPTDDYGSLSYKLSLAGRDLLKRRLPDILNNTYDKTPQEIPVCFEYQALRYVKTGETKLLWWQNIIIWLVIVALVLFCIYRNIT